MGRQQAVTQLLKCLRILAGQPGPLFEIDTGYGRPFAHLVTFVLMRSVAAQTGSANALIIDVRGQLVKVTVSRW